MATYTPESRTDKNFSHPVTASSLNQLSSDAQDLISQFSTGTCESGNIDSRQQFSGMIDILLAGGFIEMFKYLYASAFDQLDNPPPKYTDYLSQAAIIYHPVSEDNLPYTFMHINWDSSHELDLNLLFSDTSGLPLLALNKPDSQEYPLNAIHYIPDKNIRMILCVSSQALKELKKLQEKESFLESSRYLSQVQYCIGIKEAMSQLNLKMDFKQLVSEIGVIGI